MSRIHNWTTDTGVKMGVRQEYAPDGVGVNTWQDAGRPFKVNDPNFVHPHVLTPRWLDVAIGVTVVVIAAGIGSLFL